jgi:hypothetical protein
VNIRQGDQRVKRCFVVAWIAATGPRTAEGKAKSASNGKVRQKGPRSIREIRAELGELRGLLQAMKETRRVVVGAVGDDP